jgi:hypothetical protein
VTLVQTGSAMATQRGLCLGVAAYLVPTFPIAYAWHLVVFAPAYDALAIYRPDPIIPLGLASMIIQGFVFSLAYPRLFPCRDRAILKPGMTYGLGLAALSWSFTTLAVAAKSPMASVPLYIALETGFTLLQFVIVGPLTRFPIGTERRVRMPKYVIAYRGGKQSATAQERTALMARWKDWVGELGSTMVDPGKPLGEGKLVSSDGVSERGSDRLNGFSILQADSISCALEIAQRCPFLEIGTIELAEILETR